MSETLVITPAVVDSAVALQRSADPDDYRRTTQAAIAGNTPAFSSLERDIYTKLCQFKGIQIADSVRWASMLSVNILMTASDEQHLFDRVNHELACSAGIVSVAGLLTQTYQQELQTIFEGDYAGSPPVLDMVDRMMKNNTAERFGARLTFGIFGSLVNLDHKRLSLPKTRVAAPRLHGSRQIRRALSR